ncbi:HIT family protein [Caedibacter taeniospiralis]|jgi:diadenosine tetraphosphate (Ap4A) HIT family hydrolase|uniref:HIT family protein n=1 Tax=Caedibacter taeniospiralis TaxID=28907 RepID=UPI0037C0D93F
MNNFKLDRRLAESSSLIKDLGDIELRLSNNALVPWFLLIPKVQLTEWFELEEVMQIRLNKLVNALSAFLKTELKVDKINVATIGNVVSQMHIHVVGRKQDDFCWPDVVWGKQQFKPYTDDQRNEIIMSLLKRCSACVQA